MITIHIADDHKLIIEAYRKLLQQHGFRVNGHSYNGSHVIDWINSGTYKADILLLDISMPNKDGFEVLKYFQKKNIQQKTLIISAYEDIAFVQKATTLNANGYLRKEEASDLLIEAVNKIYEGDLFFLSKVMKEKIVERHLNLDQKNIPLRSIFSARETQVLELLKENLNDKEVAKEMAITPSTVRSCVFRMKNKIGATSRIGLMQYALNKFIK